MSDVKIYDVSENTNSQNNDMTYNPGDYIVLNETGKYITTEDFNTTTEINNVHMISAIHDVEPQFFEDKENLLDLAISIEDSTRLVETENNPVFVYAPEEVQEKIGDDNIIDKLDKIVRTEKFTAELEKSLSKTSQKKQNSIKLWNNPASAGLLLAF